MRDFIKNLFRPRQHSADLARERLQIVVSHQRQKKNPNFLPKLQQELLDVISKYVKIDRDQINVDLGESEHQSVLKLNITIPDQRTKQKSMAT